MFKKSLILAGLLSLVSISAQANDRVIINADNNDLEGLSDVTTTEAGGRGGAVQNAAGHNLTVHGTFSNNSINAQNEGEITLGGAIFQQGGTLTVQDGTTFSNNKANGHEQSYPDYPQNDYPSGGAITQMGGTFTGQGKVTFSGNVAGENSENSTGGAIYFGGNTNATFENVTFDKNKSGLYGGAIYADSSKVTINGTGEFTGNESWHGGAVMIFGDNDSTSFKTGKGSTFSNNKAGGNGGAIANYYGTVEIGENSTFTNNTAAKNGGAIYNDATTDPDSPGLDYTGKTTVKDGVTFSGNKAVQGGAIYNAGELTVEDNVTFENNNAELSGSAISNYGSSLKIGDNVTFKGNTALTENPTADGKNSGDQMGALYSEGTTDRENKVTIGSNVKFENNKAGGGAGLYLYGGNDVTIGDNATFTGNETREKLGSEAIGGGGGAISMTDGGTDKANGAAKLSIGNNATFSGNKAKFGGAVTLDKSSELTIGENAQFTDNQALGTEKGFGGAIYNDGAKLEIGTGATFSQNKAQAGGAIFTGKNITINDAAFTNNNATAYGGALYAPNGMTVKDSTFTGNSAKNGGAIFTQGDLTIQAENKDIKFSGNTATSGGADVYLYDQGSMTITTSGGHKVIFGSNDSIAGSGNITNNGIVEFQNNQTVNHYTGTYTQTGENTKTTLNNSDMFNKFDIHGGELELKDGGKATIGENKKFNGKKLTVTGDGSVLTLGDATENATIGENVIVNIGQGAKVDIINGQLTLNSQAPASAYSLFALTSGDETFDTWQGTVHVGNGEGSQGELVLDGFSHNTTDGTYLQDGGKLTLQNGSNLTLDDAQSSISGGDVAVESGTTLGVENGASVSGGTFDVKGDMEVGQQGTVSGGTFDVESQGHFDVQSGGQVSGGTFDVESQGHFDVKQGGTVTGGTVDVKSGGTLDVEGTVNGNTQLNLESGSTTNVTDSGDLTVKSGSTWAGDVKNDGGTVTVDGLESKSGKYTQSGNANLNVKGEDTNFELKSGDSIEGGQVNVSDKGTVDVNGGNVSGSDINVSGGTLDVKSGTVSGSDIDVNGGGTLNVEGGTVSNSDIDVSGEGSKLAVGGEGKGSITGGTIDITDGADLAVENNGSISGNAQITANGGNIDVKEGGTIEGGNITAKNGGSLNVEKGGSISDGEITVEGSEFTVEEGGTVTGGDITLGEGASFDSKGEISGGDFHFKGKIDGDVKIENSVDKESNFNIEGGNNYLITKDETHSGALTLNGGDEHADNWDDNSSIQLGSSRESNDGGTLTFEGTKNGSNGILHANNGSLNVKGGDQALDIGEGSYVYKEVKTNVEANSTLDVTEGDVTLNGNGGEESADDADTWAGKVQVSGGSLTLDNMTGKTGTFEQTAGSTTVKGEFDMNQDGDSITGGSVTIGDGSTTSTLDQSNGSISGEARVDIKEHGALQMSGGTTTLNEGDTWNGDVTVSSGELTVDGFSGNNAKSGKLTQSGGKLNVKSDFDVNNEGDNIAKEAEVVLSDNAKFGISNGEVTLNGDDEHADTWGNAHVDLTNGTLTLDGITNDSSTSKARAQAYHGRLTATGGNLNIKNGSDLVLQDGDIIGSETITNLESGNKLTINDGGSASFDNEGDKWEGYITLNEGGTLNYGGTSNGKLTAVAGNLFTTQGSKLSVTSDSTIEDAVNAQINGALSIGDTSKGAGTVSLNDGDTVLGDITINSQGVLNMGNGVNMKSPQESEANQKITFNDADSTLNLNGDHAENGGLNLKADLVSTSDKDGHINKNGSGDVLFSGSTSKYSGNLTLHKSGNLYFDDRDGFGGSLEFGDDIAGEHIGIYSDKFQGTTKLDKAATLTYSTRHGDVDLVISDDIEVSNGGTINAFAQNGRSVTLEEVKAHDEGTVNASGVDVTIDKDITVDKKSTVNAYAKNEVTIKEGITAEDESNVNISGTSVNIESNGITAKNHSNVNIAASDTSGLGKVTLEDSRLSVAGTGYKADSTTFKGESSVSLVDGILTDSSTGNITFTEAESTGSFGIDISGRDWKSDRILTGSVSGGGTINVDNWDFINKCPIDRDVYLQVFEGQGLDAVNFTATNKEVFTPIGDYRLFSNGGGNYRASLVRYNDQVFRGQVSTIANFQNQLTINNMLFNHTQEINMQYLAQHSPNRYAAAFPQFAPYQYDKKDGSLWFKPFGTFERLDLGRNLDVENNFYGALIGGDFPAVELKKGWTLLPTAYVGYTGAHQNYANTSMYQNGGQGGLMATFMKNDFIGSVLAYGGGYGNEMDVTGLYNYAGSYNDKAGNWYVGAAVKTAYNFHPGKHFVIQPSLLASYSLFGKQGWHTDYGDMHMRSGYLNGVNVAPGINFIYGRETWSTYLTVQYFFNIMSSVDGQAGNVDLHRLGMDHGFLEYGFGITKTWKDRLSGYFQMVIRNVGRTGVGFQGGLMFKL